MGSAAFDIMQGGILTYQGGLYQQQQNMLQQQQNMLQGQQQAGLQNLYNQGWRPPSSIIKEERIMNSFRAYLDKHRDLIFTVALCFIVDHYFLGGAMKERIKKLLEGFLNKAESNFHKEISS
jgi:hypothetical protein